MASLESSNPTSFYVVLSYERLACVYRSLIVYLF